MNGNSMEMALALAVPEEAPEGEAPEGEAPEGGRAVAGAVEGAEATDAVSEEADPVNGVVTITRRVSSSMRFYLLKKRFSKPAPAQQGIIQNLEHERYLIT